MTATANAYNYDFTISTYKTALSICQKDVTHVYSKPLQQINVTHKQLHRSTKIRNISSEMWHQEETRAKKNYIPTSGNETNLTNFYAGPLYLRTQHNTTICEALGSGFTLTAEDLNSLRWRKLSLYKMLVSKSSIYNIEKDTTSSHGGS